MSFPATPVTDFHDVTKNFDYINAFGVPVKMIDHDPTDADFTNARDGYAAINYSSSTLFFRTLGVWKGVVLT